MFGGYATLFVAVGYHHYSCSFTEYLHELHSLNEEAKKDLVNGGLLYRHEHGAAAVLAGKETALDDLKEWPPMKQVATLVNSFSIYALVFIALDDIYLFGKPVKDMEDFVLLHHIQERKKEKAVRGK